MISVAEKNKDRLYCTGPMIPENYKDYFINVTI
jgi:hypothetical protein